MAKKQKVEPTVTFLNTPPSGAEIIKHLFTVYMRSKGIELEDIKVKPSETGKNIIKVRDGEYLYTAIEGEGVKCERL